MFVPLAVSLSLVISITTTASQGTTPTPLPNYTPPPTYTPLPPHPTYTPLPTYTPVPAYIVFAPPTVQSSSTNTDWLDIILELIKCFAAMAAACAWPLTVVLLVVALKSPLLNLIRDIRRFRYGKFEAVFGKEVRRLEQRADEAELPSVGRMEEELQPERASSLYRLAETSPRAAIIEAWLLVEDALREVAMRLGLDVPSRAPAIQVLGMLERRRLAPQKLLSISDELRYLRNIAVHESDFDIGTDKVINYINLSLRTAGAFDNLGKAETLRGWLEMLNQAEFEALVGTLLTPSEQDALTPQVARDSFLNDMRLWGRLEDIEQYLTQRFPERFQGRLS